MVARGTKRGRPALDDGDVEPQVNGHALPAQSLAVPGKPTLEPVAPSVVSELRQGLSKKFKDIAGLWIAAKRPLPDKSGDGSYLPQSHEDFLKNFKGLHPDDIKTFWDLASDAIFQEPWDDRKYLLEKIVETAADLDPESATSIKLTNGLLTALYNDLRHPPQSYIGDTNFRNADGSNNNFFLAKVGAANSPYARTVSPKAVQPSNLPEPGLIFDSIFKRTEPEEHPNKISSMLFYVATIIIHDLFRTSHEDSSISMTSSYLDLSPLYGSTAEEQKTMRTFSDGKLKPDCFSEKRILGFPPGVGALLIMFNRFHNHVVENLAEINEGGRFTKPAGFPIDPIHHDAWLKRDENLFQTGRLVTCGLYINIILLDYVRTILNLNRTDSDWKLDPRVEIPGGPPLGAGNQVSAEFNLIYRWHSTISTRDEKWIEDTYSTMLKGKNPKDMSEPEMMRMLGQLEAGMSSDPQKRHFGSLKRGADGKYADGDLVDILVSGIEDCANKFGAQSVPAVLRAVEVLGMKQARSWEMATLNEFRAHFRLKKYETFEEINPDKTVSEQLRHLYDTPDHVELYPGLVCEDTKEAKLPGAGLCPGYTTSRAILSDAVALVRGDRFYTIDYTPSALTNWGFSEASSNKAFDHGCVFYKLFNTAFPNHFEYNSIYAHYPLTIPGENLNIMRGLKKDHLYTFSRPQPKPQVQTVSSYQAATTVMNNKHGFGVAWGQAMVFLMGEPALDFMLAGDGPPNANSREMMGTALYPPKTSSGDSWQADVKNFYLDKTRELLADPNRSYRLTTSGHRRADIIRDITNLVSVHFCAQIFDLPLKTDEHPHGVFSEQELYLVLAAVFVCVFFDADPVHSFEIHEIAYDACQKLGNIVQANVTSIKDTGVVSNFIQYFLANKEETSLHMFGVRTIQTLLRSGMDVHQLVWGHILGTAGGMVPNQGQLFSEMLDFYLNDPIGQKYWPDVVREAQNEDTPESDDRLMHYMLEGSRLSCGSAVMRKVREDTQIKDGTRTLDLREQERVFVNLFAASRDPAAFPDPLAIKLDRDVALYLQLGHGPHKCLGFGLAQVSMTAMLRVVASLKNLRPVPGDQGTIKKVPAGGGIEGYNKYVIEDGSGAHYFPFPMSMKVEWDDADDEFAEMQQKTLQRRATLPLLNGDEAADAPAVTPARRGSKRGGRGGSVRGSKRARR